MRTVVVTASVLAAGCAGGGDCSDEERRAAETTYETALRQDASTIERFASSRFDAPEDRAEWVDGLRHT